MAFKFRAASGDLSGSPSAREGPAPTIGIRSIVSLYPRIGSGGLVGPSVPGVPGRVVTFTDFKTWPNSMPNTTHPPHANGTQGPQGDQITSIEASFVFHWHSLKTRKLSIRPHHREVHRVAAKVTPPPSPASGCTKGLFGTPHKWLGT